MRWADGFIAVDWGTTNRRAYRLDASGRVAGRFEDECGVMAVPADGFAAAAAAIRTRLGDLPMLMAGMVGSTRGWTLAPYVPCPAGIEALARALAWPEPGRTAIVPGLSIIEGDDADVMRGEETQLIGAAEAGLLPAGHAVCHPGTHNKWARMEADRIAWFRTAMTGELFDLLREHSILADMMAGPAEPGAAFGAAVHRALAGDEALASALFGVRARALLGTAPAADGAATASGLLIGADVAAGLRAVGDGPVAVIGRPALTRLYAAAIGSAGRETVEIDGEDAFVAGALSIVRRIDGATP